MGMNFRVAGLGFAVPKCVRTSDELGPQVGRTGDWIKSRTGVERRRIADESMDVLAARAAREALGDGPPPDLIINASITPLQLIPDSSVFIQEALGFSGIPCFSIHASCLSFLVATYTAVTILQSGGFRRILVVSSETGTGSLNYEEKESAVLIGDGAAAAVYERSAAEGHNSSMLGYSMKTYPEGATLTQLRGCGTRFPPNDPATVPTDNMFSMNGPGVYRLARNHGGGLLADLLDSAGLTLDDVDVVVPHQMSGPGIEAIQKYGIPREKIVSIIADYGNCIAASIPMALYMANAQGRLKPGNLVLMLGTGAGLSVAGAAFRW